MCVLLVLQYFFFVLYYSGSEEGRIEYTCVYGIRLCYALPVHYSKVDFNFMPAGLRLCRLQQRSWFLILNDIVGWALSQNRDYIPLCLTFVE